MTQVIHADFCVAGAGPAGSVLASKLAATRKHVVLLDQGPGHSEADRSAALRRGVETLNDYADYNDDASAGTVTPHSSGEPEGNVVDWMAQRLFGLGGTALHFEAIMGRPLADDLRVRSLYGLGRDWPIAYTELEPWLVRAEQEVGVAGNDDNPYASPRSAPFPMPGHTFSYFDREIFGPALASLGITGHSSPRAIPTQPYGGRSECLACRACKFCPSGARYSPDRVHIRMIEGQDNVTILPGVSLRRLETGPAGDRIVAAHTIRVADRTPVVIRAERFVLALGGVETPRLLLLSGDGGGTSAGLGNMGGQLGRGFSDHVHPYVTYDLGAHAGSRLGFETMVTEHFRAAVDRRDENTFWMLGSPAMDWFPVGVEAATWAMRGDVLSLDTLRESIPRMVTLSGMVELEGNGMLALDPGTLDEFGSPVARVTMTLTGRDRRAPRRMGDVAHDIGEAMGAESQSEITPPDFGLGYHPSGATAMADSPDEGVCDRDLRVFGLGNLYIVSNSVFPHMGANPPTLTIIALALRLAAHLEGGVAP
jgi:choline dehydrogenase-like flavoprotein